MRQGLCSQRAQFWATLILCPTLKGWAPCRPGGPHRFRAGDKITGGPQVGRIATQALPPEWSPMLHSGAQNEKWPASGPDG